MTTVSNEYVSLHTDAVKILQKKYKTKQGNAKDKVDIYLYSNGREVPTQVYVATSWDSDEFPFPILTLPEKRLSEIQRGFVILFNRDLTRYMVVKPRTIRGISPSNGKIQIPLDRVDFFKV